MEDNQFWELVDKYERGDITSKEVIEEICAHTKSYQVATADLALIITDRALTTEEKNYIKDILDKKGKKKNGTNKS